MVNGVTRCIEFLVAYMYVEIVEGKSGCKAWLSNTGNDDVIGCLSLEREILATGLRC
jgi:hypothetical protein